MRIGRWVGIVSGAAVLATSLSGVGVGVAVAADEASSYIVELAPGETPIGVSALPAPRMSEITDIISDTLLNVFAAEADQ